METEKENLDSLNETEGTVETNEEEVLDTSTEDSEEQPEFSEAERRLYARAKKAEKELRDLKKNPARTTESATDLTMDDLYALMEAKVPKDDMPEVKDYAKLKGISVSEALKSSVVKALLSEKAEHRATAQASNTGKSRAGTSKLSDEALLEQARSGKISKLSDEDVLRLARLKV